MAIIAKLPLSIFTVEKRGQVAMQSLQSRIPNVRFDRVELEEDMRTGQWFLRVAKEGRILTIDVDPETFPELRPEQFALLVLFAG